jgi:hypothetical protein
VYCHLFIISKGNWNHLIFFFLLSPAFCFRSHNYISGLAARASHLKRKQFPTLFTGLGSIVRTFHAHTLRHVLFLLSSVGGSKLLPPFKHVHTPTGDLHSNVCPAKPFPEQVNVPPLKHSHLGADGTVTP